MGNGHGKQEENILDAILCNEEAQLEYILRSDNEAVNAPLLDGMTNPICRAAYLGKRNIVAILLKHGADINLACGGKGNTPVMWAAWRNNLKMVQYLHEVGADMEPLNNEGLNVLDIAIIRMSYETALFLKKQGLAPKEPQFYHDKLAIEFDVELFIDKLENEEEIASYKIFHERIQQQEREWIEKDLVVDPRESWSEWFQRNIDFDEPPMIPREELPEEHQPHNSIYGKLSSYMNGVNPYPPGHKYNPVYKKKRNRGDIEDRKHAEDRKGDVGDKSNPATFDAVGGIVDLDNLSLEDSKEDESNEVHRFDEHRIKKQEVSSTSEAYMAPQDGESKSATKNHQWVDDRV